MSLYNVHYLEHYADRFIELGLRRYGLTLEQYLPAPQLIENLYLHTEPRPLLAKQQRVQQRLDADDNYQEQHIHTALEAELDHLPRRNGVAIEPLHHKRHSKHSSKCNFRRKAQC